MKMSNEHKIGWVGFGCAFLGFGIAFTAGFMGFHQGVAMILFLVLQVAGLSAGIISRNTLQGKVAIGISGLILFFALNEMFCHLWLKHKADKADLQEQNIETNHYKQNANL